MGDSFKVMRVCHGLEVSRRLRMSVKGSEDRIWTCSSFGSARNSRSNGMLRAKKLDQKGRKPTGGEDGFLPFSSRLGRCPRLRRLRRLGLVVARLRMQERDLLPYAKETALVPLLLNRFGCLGIGEF